VIRPEKTSTSLDALMRVISLDIGSLLAVVRKSRGLGPGAVNEIILRLAASGYICNARG
jgi:hypothetical protein